MVTASLFDTKDCRRAELCCADWSNIAVSQRKAGCSANLLLLLGQAPPLCIFLPHLPSLTIKSFSSVDFDNKYWLCLTFRFDLWPSICLLLHDFLLLTRGVTCLQNDKRVINGFVEGLSNLRIGGSSYKFEPHHKNLSLITTGTTFHISFLLFAVQCCKKESCTLILSSRPS